MARRRHQGATFRPRPPSNLTGSTKKQRRGANSRAGANLERVGSMADGKGPMERKGQGKGRSWKERVADGRDEDDSEEDVDVGVGMRSQTRD
ncbi:hypothetical protein ABZP36_034302 [Zizania latifolia]